MAERTPEQVAGELVEMAEGGPDALDGFTLFEAANLLRHLLAKGPIEVGGAVATGAGRLRARWVIHGAVMGQDLRTDADLVRRTTESCLRIADELGAKSLALPAFGTGVGGFPLDECARIMVEAARSYAPSSLKRVAFAVFGPDAKAAFDDALRTPSTR
jgi:O-acetyl-ADP-ribose deacetylase (regulator of RNase III)